MKKTLALVLALSLCLLMLAACGGGSSSSVAPADTGASTPADTSTADDADVDADKTSESTSFKAAAIFGGAINDGNWNETQYNGLVALEKLGAEISYMENIGDTDAAEAARSYAADAYNLIYLTTNSYQDYCSDLAVEFPEVTFIQINGTLVKDNFISIRIADEEQGFLQGVAAALLTETGMVGFVGGMEINPIKLGSSGFQQGVDYANEKYGLSVEATRINTGSFTDVNQAKETAISLIESGCDVVTPMANDASVGVMEAAEEKGVMAVACGLGQDASAPTATRVTVVKDVAVAYEVTGSEYATTGSVTAPAEVETYGANKGVVYVTDWMNGVDPDVETKVMEVVAEMAAGGITISTEV